MTHEKRSGEKLKMVPKIHCSAEKGFTLIETMVVVVIISLMALFVGPELINFGPNMRIKAAARDLHTNLQKMKVEAIKRNREAVITFTPVACPPANAASPKGSYTIDIDGDSDNYDLPQNTALCKEGELTDGDLTGGKRGFYFTTQGLWFDNDNNAIPGDFQIQNDRGRTYRVSVSIAGGIKTEKL